MAALTIINTVKRQLKEFASSNFLIKDTGENNYIVVNIGIEDYLRPNGKLRHCTYSDKDNVGIYRNIEDCFKAMAQYHKREKNYRTAISEALASKNEEGMIDYDTVLNILRTFKNSEKELN